LPQEPVRVPRRRAISDGSGDPPTWSAFSRNPADS